MENKLNNHKYIALGKIGRPHGVHGAFIVHGYSDDCSTILLGRNLYIISDDPDFLPVPLNDLKVKAANQGLIMKVRSINNRDLARELQGLEIAITRDNLSELPQGEYYWADLEGLNVATIDGQSLGVVKNFLDAGAGLILVVFDGKKEYLIPFNEVFIAGVDIEAKLITIDPIPGLLD